MYIRKGGEWRAIQSVKIRKNNAWRPIVQIKMYVSGAWREVGNFVQPPSGGGGGGGGTGGSGGTGNGSITATASPQPCEGIGSTNVTTEACIITPTGGRAPYSYVWTITSGLATINSPSSASTTFTRGTVAVGTTTVTARCVVTDSLSTSVTVSGISVTFTNSGGGTP